MPQQARRKIELSRRQAEQFHSCLRQSGAVRSAMIYQWVIAAARLAIRRPELLPREGRAARGDVGPDKVEIAWTQSAEEYERCVASIESVEGCTLSGVIRWMVQAYIDAGGDPLTMEWPPKRSVRLVA
jgi:hypothetical protein